MVVRFRGGCRAFAQDELWALGLGVFVFGEGAARSLKANSGRLDSEYSVARRTTLSRARDTGGRETRGRSWFGEGGEPIRESGEGGPKSWRADEDPRLTKRRSAAMPMGNWVPKGECDGCGMGKRGGLLSRPVKRGVAGGRMGSPEAGRRKKGPISTGGNTRMW